MVPFVQAQTQLIDIVTRSGSGSVRGIVTDTLSST
jgi:hypothetical protein